MEHATPDHTPALNRATLRVEEAAALLGIGKSAAYAAVHAGSLPSIRIGRRLLVPTAPLRRILDGSATTAVPEVTHVPAANH